MRIQVLQTEWDMIQTAMRSIQEFDPDVLLGYEIHSASWGYLIERCSKFYNFDLPQALSRTKQVFGDARFGKENDPWGYKKTSSLHIPGRIVLNTWRIVRSELDFISYTFENICYHVLHERVAKFSQKTLSQWYSSMQRWKTFKYYAERVEKTLSILHSLDTFGRTSQFARIFGVEFFQVMSRGSQFKVESMMFRIAKPENYVMPSPTKQQVAGMKAGECLPLVMEPETRYYTSPVVVLDFASLYPSIMIAYNYCFTTCLGRADGTMGWTNVDWPGLEEKDIHTSPNGIRFVKQHIRKGILGQLLKELLDTRVMVKESMKMHKEDGALLKLLESTQLGLKLISNVTYGYTAASFSGRMPCIEIADSIVQMGRQTLEKSIRMINTTKAWNARVVYGDTDSVFVHLENCSKEGAFEIGYEVAKAVSDVNPFPVRLKFEKVYSPCVLLAKKRYVGFKYEKTGQSPEFEAKGIETVRRDVCPAVAKVMESSLRIMFKTNDISQVKDYVTEQWAKLLGQRVSIIDFIFAKEVKLGKYRNPQKLPPHALVGARMMEADPRAEPQYKERVPYVVVNGHPNSRLKDNVIRPLEMLNDPSLTLNGEYYIEKQFIPSLDRIFSLIGVDVRGWYRSMPKVSKLLRFSNFRQPKLKTIDQYYSTSHCVLCQNLTPDTFCEACTSEPQNSLIRLSSLMNGLEIRCRDIRLICSNCTQDVDSAVECESLDCSILFERIKATHRASHIKNKSLDF